MFDEHNRFTGYQGIARNITARKRADRQLHETLRFTETLLDSMPYPVTVKDREHRFVRVNAAYEREFGADRATMLGKTTADALNDPSRGGIDVEEEMIVNPGIRSYTRARRMRGGEVRHVTITKAAVIGESGEVTGFITTHVDVTDLKEAEAQAGRHLRLSNILLDASPAPTVVKDRDLQLISCNIAYEKMFEVRREDILFRPLGRHRGEIASEIEQIERQLLAKPGVHQIERVIASPSGRRIHCIINKSTYADEANESGEVGGIITTFTDITELKQTEANLIAAKQVAEAAMRARSQFLANMSHEIRTPMNGVLGMTSLLHTTPLNSEQREYVDTVKLSGEALLKIINDILDFSKIEAGKVEIESTAFDLRSRVSAVTQLFAASARERKLRLTSEIAVDVPQIVMGDPVRIGQVLSNIVANAIKFTIEGSVHISVMAAERQAGRVTLRFEVSDSGIGIAKDAIDKIFNPFSQEDITTTRRFGGTGLGLTISRELVELMDGAMRVESTPGQGSRFSFTIPVAVGSELAALPAAPVGASVSQQVAASAPTQIHVLLAEDNKINQMVATRMLEKLGCKVTVAQDGVQAVEQVSREKFDLILMDCHMPNMDGFAATAAIRALEQRVGTAGGLQRHIIIAQTANAMEGDRETCLAASMDDYMTKPFTSDTLAAVLKRWAPGRRAASPA